MLSAKRDARAAKRFFRKMLKAPSINPHGSSTSIGATISTVITDTITEAGPR